MPVIAITDGNDLFKKIDTLSLNVRIIISKSHNFSYMVNLARFYLTTEYYFYLGDDETIEGPIDSVNQILKEKHESVSFEVLSTFRGERIDMWKTNVPRIFISRVRFVRAIHEFPILSERPYFCREIRIINESYKDWPEYWSKTIKNSKRERKSVRRFLNLLVTPVYWFFKKNGWSNGLLGLELMTSSIFYAILSIINGIKQYNNNVSLTEIGKKYYENISGISESEKNYVNSELQFLYSQQELDKYDEYVDQLCSALLP
ncbi:MAG: hypothetical protein M1113_03055 [Candidatus Thermoplasmatota archaeon]|nr:hypothetical protein [Candidatus Thermoplasmatota archaeon]